MQPLISVDHESRHSSNRVEDDQENVGSENTPLLSRFPPNARRGHTRTTVFVTFLLILVIVGAIIGIYLLILQTNSENILPPVETALHLVSRTQWDHSNVSQVLEKSSPYGLNQMIVLQTGSDQCFSTESCTKLLQEMQANSTATKGLPYNFLISSNGQTYEGLGWFGESPLNYTQSGLVLAFIGNFAQVAPTQQQIEEADNLYAESVSRRHLDSSYNIIGKAANGTPKYLFQSLKARPQWNSNLSDKI